MPNRRWLKRNWAWKAGLGIEDDVPGRLELAAEKSAGLPIELNIQIDEFICRALRGEPSAWAEFDPRNDSQTLLERTESPRYSGFTLPLHASPGGLADLAAEVRRALEHASKASVAQDMLRSHYLEKLLHCFSNQDIACLLTKGKRWLLLIIQCPGPAPVATAIYLFA